MQDEYTLVTGAAGFIGSNLARKILEENRKVVGIDNFSDLLYPREFKMLRWNELIRNFPDNFVGLNFDLLNDNFDALANFNITSIFNQAALPGLISNWADAKLYYDNNLIALNRLLEFARQKPIVSFIQASTSSVYGREAIGSEDGITAPISPYGVSKLGAEKLCDAYFRTYGVPTKILRYFSVYGPGQRPDMAFSKIIKSLIEKQEFPIFGSGNQKRSNTFIDDVVEATLSAEIRMSVGTILNICGDETISLNDVIKVLETISEGKVLIKRLPPRLGDQFITSGSNSLAKEILNWQPKYNIVVGLTQQYRYTLEHSQIR
jgi:nucleoside-diphosphate-sugar epimerase